MIRGRRRRRSGGLVQRRRVSIVAIVLVVAGLLALGVWRTRGRTPARSPLPAPAHVGAAPAAAGEPLAPARPPPRGALAIRGEVRGPDGPIAGALVTATAPPAAEPLAGQKCHCGNDCGQKLLECGCGEAARE